MINEGTYAAQLVKNDGEWLQFSYARSGNAQVLLTFELEGGQHMQGFFSITPAAAEYTLQKLHNCGFKGTSFREMLKQEPAGKVDLVIVMDEYEGKTRPKIKFINRQGGFSIKPEDRIKPDDLDRLSKMVAAPADAFSAGTNAASDDIPF